MILGISGKMQSGKDEVAKMWQYVDYAHSNNMLPCSIDKYTGWLTVKDVVGSDYQIKYFAGKLRQFVSDITGISVEDLTRDEIKNTIIPSFNKTPRQLLQLIGTEVCRAVDSDFHVIALMNDYKGRSQTSFTADAPIYGIPTEEDELKYGFVEVIYPNWLISDVRFPNEVKAIEDRKGVVIRVERSWENRYPESTSDYKKLFKDGWTTKSYAEYLLAVNGEMYYKHTHPSETSLDDHQFEYTIDNNGTLEELLNKVKLVYDLINN